VTRDTEVEATLVAKWATMGPVLDERGRRLWAAAESEALGYGGDSVVSAATGLARATIRAGRAELAQGVTASHRVRRAGAGRPEIEDTQPGVTEALDVLVEPLLRGDPMSPLRWTCKSTAKLAGALTAQGFRVSATTVGRLLRGLGYRMHALAKAREGAAHPDRNAQFEHINATARAFIADGHPVISVDTKKKELVGDFKNGGREWRPTGQPIPVRVHDFLDRERGKAIPYGVYDLANNEGWVSVGVDHDTAEFAVNAIRLWWTRMGRHRFPRAHTLVITADGGGSNGPRLRLWKWALQRLADDFDLTLSVCHFPPGTSKWNKIEHRLFSFISQNWRGKPLVSHQAIVNLIAATTTRTGLRVKAALDTRRYETARPVPDEVFDRLRITPHAFHGDWNYTIAPRH